MIGQERGQAFHPPVPVHNHEPEQRLLAADPGSLVEHQKHRNMNTKVLIAALAAGVASFLLGWVVYGMLLEGYMKAHTTEAAHGVWKQMENMNWLGMIISNLAWGVFLAWSLSRMGVNDMSGGFVAGAIIGGLVAINIDLFFYSMMNWYTDKMVVIVDVLVSTVFHGILGAVTGIVLGMGNKATAKA
jgi:pentatricopeptide repeat protein